MGTLAPGMRVAVYARVSTSRQAEADLLIPDQSGQAEAWCRQNGTTLVRRCIEPRASGTDESRPVFQAMLTDARSRPRPFDIVLVHSFSRFCRDEFTYATAKLDLTLGDDHTGQMVGSILVSFDAYQSRENGKHTSRAMKENARQGFWNGSRNCVPMALSTMRLVAPVPQPLFRTRSRERQTMRSRLIS